MGVDIGYTGALLADKGRHGVVVVGYRERRAIEVGHAVEGGIRGCGGG